VNLIDLNPREVSREHYKTATVGFDWNRRGSNFIKLHPDHLGLSLVHVDNYRMFVIF
jgi:hypothetical protein